MPHIDFGFWEDVLNRTKSENRPIFAVAPMAEVTDAAFRKIIATCSGMGTPTGGPDVMWTEFVSADGLCSAGREVLLRDLEYDECERPIVVQLFTSHPEKMFQAAQLVAGLGFDGLDINMGCPDRSIEKQGAGAAMIKNPALAKEIIEAARAGVAEYAKHNKNKKSHNKKLSPIPVSVKTRLGYATADIEQWLGFLLEQNLPALTVHLRTRKEMSDVSAHWELMPEIVRLRDTIMSPSMSPLPSSSLSPFRTIILGNGDVTDCADATAKAAASGADGVMFGRAIFGNPWLFNRLPHKNFDSISITDRLNVMVEHTFLFEKMFAGVKNFSIMKKHYKAYVNGWDGAKDVRMKLMDAQSAREVAEIVQKYLKK